VFLSGYEKSRNEQAKKKTNKQNKKTKPKETENVTSLLTFSSSSDTFLHAVVSCK